MVGVRTGYYDKTGYFVYSNTPAWTRVVRLGNIQLLDGTFYYSLRRFPRVVADGAAQYNLSMLVSSQTATAVKQLRHVTGRRRHSIYRASE